MREYRRFLYLAVRAGHPVTPSDAVDQAWHLHLCYTRSYWEELCGEVLGQPLHHGPTKGGRAEGEKFHDWYERTLASYREAFGEAAPATIWPASRERFLPPMFERVDRREQVVISKKRLRQGGLAAAGLVLAGCAESAGLVRGDLVAILIFGFVGLVIFGTLFKSAGGKGKRRGGRRGGSGCGTGSGWSSDGDDDDRGGGGWFSGGDSGGSSGCGSSGCGGGGCGGGD